MKRKAKIVPATLTFVRPANDDDFNDLGRMVLGEQLAEGFSGFAGGTVRCTGSEKPKEVSPGVYEFTCTFMVEPLPDDPVVVEGNP